MKKSALAVMIVFACVALVCNVALAKQRFQGVVEQMPEDGYTGQWVIGGRTVNATTNTKFREKRGKLQIGSYVQVEGSQVDGNFLASEIKSRRKK